MLQPKRKKITLDKNSKLAPIDEGLLKSRTKLAEVETPPDQDIENKDIK